MTDISELQQQWQKELGPLLESTKEAVYQSNNYAGDLEKIGERLGNAHGLSRLRIPFVKATKVSWLRHKRKKVEKQIEADKTKLADLVSRTFVALKEKVAAQSDYAVEYNYLTKAIGQLQETQATVTKAAKKCRNASAAETVAAVDNGISPNIHIDNNSKEENAAVALELIFRLGTDLMAYTATRRATRAFNTAEQAVRNLQETLQQEMPQVDGRIADNMASSNDPALMMDMFGGMLGTFSNWNMAEQLSGAKSHLRDVAGQLGDTMSKMSQDRQTLMETTLAQARKSSNEVGSFAAELEGYMAQTATVESVKKAALDFPVPNA